jgi:DNA-binding IclR family transcriptional regulator
MNTRTHPAARPYEGTQAVQRALTLLKAFRAERPERTVAELADETGLNRTTTYRLLSALSAQGLLERTGETWRIGPELLSLGAAAFGAGGLRAAARPELEALAAETGETATLEVLAGGDVLILDEVVSRHVVGTVSSVGTRWPAHTTSTGKALLAHAAPETLERLLARPLAATTSATIAEPDALRRELARVRERGFAISAEELEPGFVAVGAPVRAGDGSVTAALSVGGPRLRLDTARRAVLARAVTAAAARVSERLGFRAERPVERRRSSR